MTPALSLTSTAERLGQQLDELARHSGPGAGVTRLALTDEYMRGLEFLTTIAGELGMQVHYDAVGNFYATRARAGEATIALGSHIDSVPHGGRFDGTVGVLCGFEVARLLPELPLTVVSFIGEEGSRFPGGLLGSRCLVGQLGRNDLQQLRDAAGLNYVEAASQRGFQPLDVAQCPQEMRDWQQYIEVHIEQGRVLQDEGTELGIVTDIVGMIQGSLHVSGRADHAGATPMPLRSDAGLTAAEVAVELERLARDTGGEAVATVGDLRLSPGARNVIPGEATVGLDIRSPRMEDIDRILNQVLAFAGDRARERGQQVRYQEDLRSLPVAMNKRVVDGLSSSAQRLGLSNRQMVSGAGHDAMLVAPFVPTGMVFVPCKDGISHSPEEYAQPQHLAQAVALLVDYLTTPTQASTPLQEEQS